MSNELAVSAGGNISLGGLVFVVLLVLKLTGLAQLSWFWVFLPLWAPCAMILSIFLVVMVVGIVCLGIVEAYERICSILKSCN